MRLEGPRALVEAAVDLPCLLGYGPGGATL